MDRFERELLEWLTDGGGNEALASVRQYLVSAPWDHTTVQWLNEIDELIYVSLSVHGRFLRRLDKLQDFLYPDGRMQKAHWVNRNPDAHFEPVALSKPPGVGPLRGHHIQWHPVFSRASTTEEITEIVDKALDFLVKGDLDGADEWATSMARGGFYTVQARLFRTIHGVRDQIDARNHSEACWRLDAKPAGLKARDLLMGMLDDNQIDTLIKYGHFDVIKTSDFDIRDLPQSQMRYFRRIRGRDRRYMLYKRHYRIFPAWPNGNVVMVAPSGDGIAHFCLHPPNAFPDDDIALAQKLLIESDELQFWHDSNVTPHARDWTVEEIASQRYTDRNEFLHTLGRTGGPTKVHPTIAAARSHAIAQAT